MKSVHDALLSFTRFCVTPETEGLPGAGIAFSPELLRQQGIQWKARLAPDGSAPGETPTERRSWLTFGTLANGGCSLNGWFTTLDRAIIGNVCAGQLSDAYLSAAAANPVPGAADTPSPDTARVVDATLVPDVTPCARVEFRETEHDGHDNCGTPPKGTSTAVNTSGRAGEVCVPGKAGVERGSDPPDPLSPAALSPCPQQPDDIRSRSEKQAGILRAVFEAAARHPGTPTMGGAAPTVLVHINITDLLDGRGAG
ncbi:hypothetical protein [Cryobacterium sp. TMT1-66-1]|uniref:hypothetical protein n=2 Tax=unclassified Cryobacterium TaxID=2649013 RepID=UPI001069B031|nr:hypothetical protein [Cryobacterium sp. TMT1-66-1]TFD07702.1 hypothetical protein E3T29_07460 [Cryobacterium sp. TMT1-66-1]